MRQKVSLGIEKLDELLGGGIPLGSIILVTGPAGSGKTTFLRAFLHKGMEQGETGIYIMSQRNPDYVIEDMRLFNWEVDTTKLKFLAFDGIIPEPKPYVYGNYSSLTDLAGGLRKLSSELNGKPARCIMDNLSSFFIPRDESHVFQFLQLAFRMLRSSNITAMLQLQSDAHDPKTVAIMESLCDGTIELKREGEERFLRVLKLDSGQTNPHWTKFEIGEKMGIRVLEFYR